MRRSDRLIYIIRWIKFLGQNSAGCIPTHHESGSIKAGDFADKDLRCLIALASSSKEVRDDRPLKRIL